jgi:hypothetical protein
MDTLNSPRELCLLAISRRSKVSQAEELIIAQDAKWAAVYALEIRGQWPEGEEIICRDPEFAYKYAKHVLHKRWYAAEDFIFEHPVWRNRYAITFLDGRIPKWRSICAPFEPAW